MTLPALQVWEVRPAGGGASDSNGGGFDPSVTSPGTDFSQQDAAQVSYSDLVIGATTTNLTSAAHPFGATHVGNTIQITGGTGFTTGFYSVRSVSGVVATMDRAAGTAASTGGVGGLGGALASPGMAAGAMVAANKCWVKAGTYGVTSTTANVSGGRINCTLSTTAGSATHFEGYQTTRGDKGTKPVLQAQSPFASGTLVILNGEEIVFDNLALDGGSLTAVVGCNQQGAHSRVIRCSATRCNGGGFIANAASAELTLCEAYSNACTSGNYPIYAVTNALVSNCVSHNNACAGFACRNGSALVGCASVNNTGAASDGFTGDFVGAWLVRCTASGNGRHGFYLVANSFRLYYVQDCLAVGNAGYGFGADAGLADYALLQNCAAQGNTSGPYNAANLTNLSGFVTLTADPFVNAAGGNFTLNTVAGGGAACRAAGLGTFPGLPNTLGYPDIGAVQHADSGGGLLFGANWEGGYE